MDSSFKNSDFLDNLAAATPTPGGGSAAAYTAAAAAALVTMISQITAGKKKYAHFREEMLQTSRQSETWRAELTDKVKQDAEAFNLIIDARRMPKDTEGEKEVRRHAVQKATYHAAGVPLQVARTALQIMETSVMLAQKANINAISDAGASAALSQAAITASRYNVKINLLGLEKQGQAQKMLEEIQDIHTKAEELHLQMAAILRERGGIS